jgi:hypothetical protein
MRFWFQVAGWALQSVWVLFQRLPKWIRILVYLWIAVVILSRGCSLAPPDHHSARLSPADAQKLKEISDNYRGSLNKADVVKLEPHREADRGGGRFDLVVELVSGGGRRSRQDRGGRRDRRAESGQRLRA